MSVNMLFNKEDSILIKIVSAKRIYSTKAIGRILSHH